jgi:hypothetical protein
MTAPRTWWPEDPGPNIPPPPPDPSPGQTYANAPNRRDYSPQNPGPMTGIVVALLFMIAVCSGVGGAIAIARMVP